jgi:hypothetical protein
MRTPTLARIDAANPVNGSDPLNAGLVRWYRVVPGLTGGALWPDLCTPGGGPTHPTQGRINSAAETYGYGWAPPDRPGAHGHFRFDGTDDVVVCGEDARLDITGKTPLSMSVWMRSAQNLGSSNAVSWVTITETGNGSTTWDKALICRGGASGKPTFYAFDGATKDATGPTNVFDGAWHMLTGTYDGANLRLYVDKDLAATTACSQTFDFASPQLVIGHVAAAGSFLAFDGSMDDAQLWAGRCLSAQDVVDLHTSALRGHPGRLNRVGRWRFAGAAAGVTYPQLERGVRGLNRGLATGAA